MLTLSAIAEFATHAHAPAIDTQRYAKYATSLTPERIKVCESPCAAVASRSDAPWSVAKRSG